MGVLGEAMTGVVILSAAKDLRHSGREPWVGTMKILRLMAQDDHCVRVSSYAAHGSFAHLADASASTTRSNSAIDTFFSGGTATL